MNSSRLKLNNDKTEFIVIGSNTKKLPQTLSTLMVIWLLAVQMWKTLVSSLIICPYRHNVTELCKNLYFQIKISGIQSLKERVTNTLVISLILPKLDYCSTLLASLPKDLINHLQMVQNTAARLITRSRKRDHISPILHHLHLLPVKKGIIYKNPCNVLKTFESGGALNLSESLRVYVPARQLRTSADQTTLRVPNRNLKSSGYQSFYYLGPRSWNYPPQKIREASSIDLFISMLKHHLFREKHCILCQFLFVHVYFLFVHVYFCFSHFNLCMASYDIILWCKGHLSCKCAI